MRSEALELLLRVEVAVLPVKGHDQADGHGRLIHGIHEAPAEDILRQRIAQEVSHAAGAERMLVLELHHGLDAERIGLRVEASAVALTQLLREHAAGAVGEDGDARGISSAGR